ncbi:hypothetical protein G6F42_028464 [Rhizopus arrhizus]|nr:hypothetical protein G6F42_028464 [Rhizopus arrhizus]
MMDLSREPVADETTGGGTAVEVPETKSLIPRGGQSELTVGRDGKIFDKNEALPDKVPDDDGLITRGRQDHIRSFRSGSNGSDYNDQLNVSIWLL